MEWKKGGGIPGKVERDLVWDCGRILERKVLGWATTLCFPWVMVEESDFDWTLSVGMRICVTLFPLCLLWRFQKRSWWQRFGTLQLRGRVGVLIFLGLSMIEKESWWISCSWQFKVRELVQKWKIGWFGKRQKVGFSQLSLFTVLWSWEVQSGFQEK